MRLTPNRRMPYLVCALMAVGGWVMTREPALAVLGGIWIGMAIAGIACLLGLRAGHADIRRNLQEEFRRTAAPKFIHHYPRETSLPRRARTNGQPPAA
jgi:hypothetical protein